MAIYLLSEICLIQNRKSYKEAINMAEMIKVSHEQLTQAYQQFERSSEQSGEMLNSLTGVVNGLEGDWVGIAGGRFRDEFKNWTIEIRKHQEMLHNIAMKIQTAQQEFERLDSELAGRM